MSRFPNINQIDAGYDVRATWVGLGHEDVLVIDAWIDGLQLLQESRDGVAVGRRRSVEQETLLALRHGGCYYVVE